MSARLRNSSKMWVWSGALPADWGKVPLKYAVQLQTDKREPNGEDQYIGLEHIESWTGRLVDELSSAADKGISTAFRRGNVLFGKLRPYLAKAMCAEFPGLCSSEFLVMQPERLLADYLEYAILTPEFVAAVDGSTYGAKMPRASWDFVRDLLMPCPPMELQRTLACFLDHETARIDRLIANQERLIELLKEKRQAVISHAVTKGLNPDAPMKDSGVEWLGEVPEHWRRLKLNQLAATSRHSFVNGPFGSDLLTSELVSEGVPVVYIRDINPLSYRRKSKVFVTPQKAAKLAFCNVQAGDVIISKVGDPPGDPAVYPNSEPDGIITQDVIRIRPNLERIEPEYLAYLLTSAYARAEVDNASVESTRKRIGLGDFKAIRVVVPPFRAQQEVIRYLRKLIPKLETLEQRARKAIELLSERRSAITSATVTGKIDVRDWQPPKPSSEQDQANTAEIA